MRWTWSWSDQMLRNNIPPVEKVSLQKKSPFTTLYCLVCAVCLHEVLCVSCLAVACAHL